MPNWSRALLDIYLQRRVKQRHDAEFGSSGERPALFSATPATGTHLGGTSVVIAGRNLTGATSVVFGVTAAASFTIDSDDQITAVSPAHAAGAVVIGVTTPKGAAGTGLAYTFT